MNRYLAVTSATSIWFTILDCETDEMVEHEVENKYGTREVAEMRFRHRAAAEYHAAKLNQPDEAEEAS